MIFKDFKIAIGNYKKYHTLSARSWKQLFLYTALLVLVCSIGIVIIPTIRGGNIIIEGLMQTLPEFTVTENGFTIAETFDFETEGIKVLATNERQITEADFGEAIQGIILDNDDFYIRNLGNTMNFTYSEFNFDGKGYSFSKNDIPSLKSFWWIATLMANIMMYGWLFISYLINGLIIGAIGIIITMFMNMHLNTASVIKMALYSKTLPYVLTAILALFGVGIYEFISLILSLVILYFSFRSIRDENEIEN